MNQKKLKEAEDLIKAQNRYNQQLGNLCNDYRSNRITESHFVTMLAYLTKYRLATEKDIQEILNPK